MRTRLAWALFGAVVFAAFPASAVIPQTERDALIDLYNSTDGGSWFDSSGWLGGVGTECSWTGVTCDETESTVVELDVFGNNLVGTIPNSIGNLTNLEELELSWNELSGEIPDGLWSLANLISLDLEHNMLSGGIDGISGLASIEGIDIGQNQLSGPIPQELAQLETVYEVWLGPNEFTTSFDELVPLLRQLENLDSAGLAGLGLVGTVPESITELVGLRWLVLSENELTGPIADALATCGKLPGLEFLLLHENQFDGELPASWDSFTGLYGLTLYGNRISGSIPPGIGVMTNLLGLELDSNRLSGPIPPEIGNLVNLETLWLANNNLSGPLPAELGNLQNLLVLVLYENQFTGAFPSFLSDVPNLFWMSLYGNRFTGSIPPQIGDFKSLLWLELDGNQFSGTIPSEIGELTQIEELWLGSNLLEGEIPSSIGNLTNLDAFLAYSNNLRGEVPPTIQNLPPDVYIDMSDNALRASDPDTAAFLEVASFGVFEDYQTLPPTDITVDAVSSFTASLSWIPIEYSWEPGGYQVLASTQPGGPYTPVVTTPTKWDFDVVVTNLQPSTTYYFIVKTITYPHGEYPYFQLNTVFSDPSGELTATTLDTSTTSPEVIVTAYPQGIFQSPDTGGATDSYTLTNVGGVATTITLTQDEDFFEQSPTTFALEAGASQSVTITGKPVPEGEYDGFAIPTGSGVDDLFIYVYLLSTPIESENFTIEAEKNRLDLIAPEGESPTGTLTFRNIGTGSFTGVASSDVQFLTPQTGLITIAPGASANVTVSSDRAKRPDAALLSGTQVGRVSLVAIAGFGKNGRRTPSNGATSASLVTVADTVKPPTADGAVPPLGDGEVALFMTSVGHVVGSVGEFVSDVSILNSYGTGPANDLKLYYTATTPGAQTKVADLKALGSSQAIGLADVVKSVFNGTAEVGTMQIRSRQATNLSASASIFNSSNPAGNYGTSIPVFRSDRSAAKGEELFITGLRKDDSGHTNLYLQETQGSDVTVRLDYLSADGKVIGSTTEAVAAFQMKSLINPLSEGTASVKITTMDGEGGLSAYATPVDRASGDTWAVTDWGKQLGYGTAEAAVIPVGGAVRGANNTFFKTDVAITNRCSKVDVPDKDKPKGTGDLSNCRDAVGRGTLRYYPNTGGVMEKEIELGLLSTASMQDVVRTAFGIETDTVGHLVFTPTAGEFALTSRTYTILEGSPATFGSTVPAIGRSSAIRSGQSRRIGALGDSTRATITARTPATNRTNFGIVEINGEPATVRVSVYYNDPRSLASGKPLGSRTYELNANQFVSQSNLVEAIVGPQRETLYGDLSGVQVQFDVISQTGAIVVYTSSVDNGTGDSILRTE